MSESTSYSLGTALAEPNNFHFCLFVTTGDVRKNSEELELREVGSGKHGLLTN
jgi:hypothetical protein